MRKLKTSLLALFLSLALTGIARAEGESADKPMKSATALKAGLVENIEDLDMRSMALDDATVEIQFIVNNEGDIGIVEVIGENCLVNTYVTQMLKDKKIYVSENLSNKLHTVTVRYVRI